MVVNNFFKTSYVEPSQITPAGNLTVNGRQYNGINQPSDTPYSVPRGDLFSYDESLNNEDSDFVYGKAGTIRGTS